MRVTYAKHPYRIDRIACYCNAVEISQTALAIKSGFAARHLKSPQIVLIVSIFDRSNLT